MQKYKLIRIAPEPRTINYTDKKTNKPKTFQTIGFLVEGKTEWINITYNDQVAQWKVGDEVTVDVKLKEYTDKTGAVKTSWSATLPTTEDFMAETVKKLVKASNEHEKRIATLEGKPANEVIPADLPF